MSWVDDAWPVPGVKIQSRASPPPVESFSTCRQCHAQLPTAGFLSSGKVCSVCGHHHVLTALERLELLTGDAPSQSIGDDLSTSDGLSFCDTVPYQKRLELAKKKSSIDESVLSVVSAIEGVSAVLSIFDFSFIGGSLGEVAGSRVVMAIKIAIERRLPFVCVTASGGARMQEGLMSLMQMAKMSAAVHQFRQTNLPFINVLTHPTFGGVSASIAMQADIIIAEQGAHIGFTGARVIANAMPQQLPDGFQTAEFLCQHGAVDVVLPRDQLAAYLARTIRKAIANRL